MFGKLLIVSNTRQICLKEVLSFELSPVPYSPANADGSLRKEAKSVLCSLLEKDVNVQRLTASPNPTVVIIDGMAVIQISKSAGASTFGELSEKYYNIISAPLFSNNCVQVHVVFDQYWENSLKETSVNDGEHPLVSRCRSEVLPLQYPGNGESTSPILRIRYGLNYLT